MISNNENNTNARLLWALLTPFILACGLIFFPLIPALCVFLDRRSRTYTGAVVLLLGSIALGWWLGPSVAAVLAFLCIATTAAYALIRTKTPFQYGILGSAGGGVLGAVALLGIVGVSIGKPVNEAVAAFACNLLVNISTQFTGTGVSDPLSIFTAMFNSVNQNGATSSLFFMQVPQEILSMSTADKLNIVRPVLEQFFAAYIPAWALAGGMLTGGAAYYLPVLAEARLSKKPPEGTAQAMEVPPFFTFKIPKYIVISIMLVLLITYFAMDNSVMTTLYVAANAVIIMLMTLQSLALFAFLMTRKGVPTILQVLILVPAALLFSWLLEFVGLFDVLFDMRAIALRVGAVKAKGKQVFTQSGLEELRKMGDKAKKDGKDGKDGEEDKK